MYDNPLNHRPSQPPAGAPAAQPVAPVAQAPVAQPGQPGVGFGQNPYAAPSMDYDPLPTYEDEGSYGLGIALGFVFGLIVFIIIMAMGKEQTKRGATHGLLAKLGLGLLFFMFGIMAS